MGQWLQTLVDLTEDASSVPNTHMVVHNNTHFEVHNFSSRRYDAFLSDLSGHRARRCMHTCRLNTQAHKNQINILNCFFLSMNKNKPVIFSILFFPGVINDLANLLVINFTGNLVALLPSPFSGTAFGFHEIFHKFTVINLINCILWLWVRTLESLCQFHCFSWSLKSLFQILAFRHSFLNLLLFTYYVPKSPCQCNWKQARKSLDSSNEWKWDLDPPPRPPGWSPGPADGDEKWLPPDGRTMGREKWAGCLSSSRPWTGVHIAASNSSDTNPGTERIRDTRPAFSLISQGCPFVGQGNSMGFSFEL